MKLTSEFYKKLIWVSLFAIAMGYLETSVVVYLRKIYFPTGFNFPLKPIENSIGVVEFWREFATIIMLIGAGFMAGKNKNEKFAWFIYSFAIWDIFYYVFLYVLLDWPSTLLDWDILFLIPVPWVGPVLAPVLISCCMILLSLIIVVHEAQGKKTKIDLLSKILIAAGSFVCIVSFCWDYLHSVQSSDNMWTPGAKEDLFRDIQKYIPQHFNWTLFLLGGITGLAGIYRVWNYSRNKSQTQLTTSKEQFN